MRFEGIQGVMLPAPDVYFFTAEWQFCIARVWLVIVEQSNSLAWESLTESATCQTQPVAFKIPHHDRKHCNHSNVYSPVAPGLLVGGRSRLGGVKKNMD